jgi:hypothetical protein
MGSSVNDGAPDRFRATRKPFWCHLPAQSFSCEYTICLQNASRSAMSGRIVYKLSRLLLDAGIEFPIQFPGIDTARFTDGDYLGAWGSISPAPAIDSWPWRLIILTALIFCKFPGAISIQVFQVVCTTDIMVTIRYCSGYSTGGIVKFSVKLFSSNCPLEKQNGVSAQAAERTFEFFAPIR